MRQSKSEVIDRNRAPRVRITYEVEQCGRPTTIELPFVMGVMCDLAGASDAPEAQKPVPERAFVEVDASRFGLLMEQLRPRVKAQVKNTLPKSYSRDRDDLLAVDLSFRSMRDFAPDKIAEQVPQLARLLAMRRQLAELLDFMGRRTSAEQRIAQLLNNEALLRQIAETTPPDDQAPTAEMPERESAASGVIAAAEAVDLSEYVKQLQIDDGDSEKLQALVRNLALAAQAQSETSAISSNGVKSVEALIAGIDSLLNDQMNEVLHAPDVRELEGTWRGLSYLVNNTETDEKLKVRVMHITKDELADTLEAFEGEMWDQSPIFRRIYTDAYSKFGGEPFGCLIGGYEFSHHPRDVGLLRNISNICALAHTPFLAAADPALFGIESWQELPNPQDLQQIVSNPAYASWHSLRESENARYIGLTLPRVLGRLPYGAKTVPEKDFAFEEESEGYHDDYVWMNAAFPMAVNINHSQKLFGWVTRIHGAETGGAVPNLPVHTFPTDDGSVAMKRSTEVAIDDRREAELAKLGLMPILHSRTTGIDAFLGAHSLQDDEGRAGQLIDPEAQANERLSANLPYLLPVSRFAHYLKAIARDKIGSFKEPADLQACLTEWIKQYVLPNPAYANDEARAKRPLAAAEVQVDSVQERPGYYNARFYLRPHYQLEGIDVSLRLVSELPSVER